MSAWGATQLAVSHIPCFEQELTWSCVGPVDYLSCSQGARSASWNSLERNLVRVLQVYSRWWGWLEGGMWKQNPHPNWKFNCTLLLILFSTAQCNHPCVLLFKNPSHFPIFCSGFTIHTDLLSITNRQTSPSPSTQAVAAVVWILLRLWWMIKSRCLKKFENCT